MPTAARTATESFLDSPEFEAALANDDGQAAKEHLAAGRPIYYGDDRYPEGLIKEYPDGHRQLIAVSAEGKVTVIRQL
ncbi:MAG: hypothetical protein GJU73_10140 [Ferrovum sp.]|jgi:hypothetical protein|uniref:hypothetical protein n=1 Tax=Ferrovum sp. TaxID=2609467 RepID=UPI002607A822|nr:hypothetical protein [Ferrovum sp.]MBW8067789.1 hypothetical protein [Ferrovum sp.]